VSRQDKPEIQIIIQYKIKIQLGGHISIGVTLLIYFIYSVVKLMQSLHYCKYNNNDKNNILGQDKICLFSVTG